MIQRITRIVLVVSLLSLMGVHLAVLQTVAWARMAITFSQNNSLSTSLQKTFDGQHPCALCLKVKKAVSSSSSLGLAQSENRLDTILPAAIPNLYKSDTVMPFLMAMVTRRNPTLLFDTPPPKLQLA